MWLFLKREKASKTRLRIPQMPLARIDSGASFDWCGGEFHGITSASSMYVSLRWVVFFGYSPYYRRLQWWSDATLV